MRPEFQGLAPAAAAGKRLFDISGSAIGLVLTGWVILLAFVAASVDTRQSGFFTQERVGRLGKRFKVIKIRTMKNLDGIDSTVTTDRDPRITRLGRFFRNTKIDELPQLINVLKGDMSFVGPRPDVPELVEQLASEDRVILSVRPGITGPATLKYRREEQLLAVQPDPEAFNREVVFPDKVRINRQYVENYSFLRDLDYILQTLFENGSASRQREL